MLFDQHSIFIINKTVIYKTSAALVLHRISSIIGYIEYHLSPPRICDIFEMINQDIIYMYVYILEYISSNILKYICSHLYTYIYIY